MAPDDIRPLLDSLKPEILPPSVKAAALRYRFEFEDGRTADFLLRDGRLSIAEGADEPDATLRGPSEMLIPLLSGEINMLTAFMRGDIGLRGSLPAAKVLYTFTRYARTLETKA